MASQVLRTSYSCWWLVWVAQNQLELKLKGRGHPEESQEVSLYSMKKNRQKPRSDGETSKGPGQRVTWSDVCF